VRVREYETGNQNSHTDYVHTYKQIIIDETQSLLHFNPPETFTPPRLIPQPENTDPQEKRPGGSPPVQETFSSKYLVPGSPPVQKILLNQLVEETCRKYPFPARSVRLRAPETWGDAESVAGSNLVLYMTLSRGQTNGVGRCMGVQAGWASSVVLRTHL